jgi:hypothetical protein
MTSIEVLVNLSLLGSKKDYRKNSDEREGRINGVILNVCQSDTTIALARPIGKILFSQNLKLYR